MLTNVVTQCQGFCEIYKYLCTSAVKRLIVINHIQIDFFYLHNISVCTVYIYVCICIYIYTHIYIYIHTHIQYIF